MRNTGPPAPPVRRASPLLPIFAGVFFLATLALIAKVATAGTMVPIVVVPTAVPSLTPPPTEPPTPSAADRWSAQQMTAAAQTAAAQETATAEATQAAASAAAAAPTPLWRCADVASGPCQDPPTPPVVTPDPHGGLPTCPTLNASNECFKVPPTPPAPDPTGAPLPVPPR